MNWKLAAAGGAVVLALVIVLALGFNTDPHAVPSVLEGRPAPEFTLQGLDGKKWTKADLHGKPAVINFWATWCYPCQAEHELLQEAATYYHDRVQFVGVVYQDQAAEVQKYLARRTNHYPQLMDDESRTAIDFGVAGVPESFVLDGTGQIVHKEAGVLTAKVLRRVLDGVLAAPGAVHE